MQNLKKLMNLLLRYLKTEQLTNQRTNGTQKKAITKDPVGGKFGVKNRENYLDTKKPVESLEWYILLQIFSILQTKSITSSQISLENTLDMAFALFDSLLASVGVENHSP